MLSIDFPPRETYRVLEFCQFTPKKLTLPIDVTFLKRKNREISKFLGSGPIQASKIILPIDFPPRETYRVLEFWQFTVKTLSFP